MSIPPVRRSPVAAKHCNLARAFELIGDRWTLLILRSALYGVSRFDDFQADLDIPRSVLSSRLAGLVETGIMERREYRDKGQRGRTEYPLTEMGESLGLPFLAMTAWGDKWLGEGKGPFRLRSKSISSCLSAPRSRASPSRATRRRLSMNPPSSAQLLTVPLWRICR